MSGQPKRILVVDDDLEVLESLQAALLYDGHHVYAASGGRQAIATYAEIKPDIIFMDMVMRGMDGYKTLEKIIKIDPDVRAVFTSGYMLDREIRDWINSMSHVDMISKPVNAADLHRMIKKYAR